MNGILLGRIYIVYTTLEGEKCEGDVSHDRIGKTFLQSELSASWSVAAVTDLIVLTKRPLTRGRAFASAFRTP